MTRKPKMTTPHTPRFNECASRARAFTIRPDGLWQDVHQCLECRGYHTYPPLAKIIRLDDPKS